MSERSMSKRPMPERSMFERPQHRRVLAVLAALDSEVLARCGFLFGGGTRIVMELAEYRESDDVDFLCSQAAGYAELRLAAKSRAQAGLFTPEGLSRLSFPREIRVDQYGIRFPVVCDGEMIKVELIREARIDLDAGVRPPWSPVRCLSVPDCYAEKLLANSDRWADRQVMSRDLLDLAALRSRYGEIPGEAWNKAERAYKSAPRADLGSALAMLDADPTYRESCFRNLSITDREDLMRGLSRLRSDLLL
jgi:hypothetical protein